MIRAAVDRAAREVAAVVVGLVWLYAVWRRDRRRTFHGGGW